MPELHGPIKRLHAWYFMSAEEMADYGIAPAEPEPTPAECALHILGPELRHCPLYDAGPPAT